MWTASSEPRSIRPANIGSALPLIIIALVTEDRCSRPAECGILCQDLDSQIIVTGICACGPRQEQTFARTDFDLQRLVIAEQGSAGQDLRQIDPRLRSTLLRSMSGDGRLTGLRGISKIAVDCVVYRQS